MDKRKIYQAIIFFVIGILLFWWVYKDTNFKTLKEQIVRFDSFWIGVSIILNLICQVVRTHRWRMLFQPLGHSPRFYNLFLAVLIMAFTNQIIPRGGEITRLAVINKTERISFSKLLGIALVERLTDFLLLIIIFLGILTLYFPTIKQLLSAETMALEQINYKQYLIIFVALICILIVIYLMVKKINLFIKLTHKINEIKRDIITGFKTIFQLSNKTIYLLDSILIYVLWLFMFYALFPAYPPTQNLSIKALVFTFGLATFAFLLPIQSGIGAWHFVVVQCLLLFDVGMEQGKAFSLVAHAATNFIYLVFGAIAFLLVPLLNRSPDFKSTQQIEL
ncbi:MAG: lysylphosphatidylglycerol synthase transmembrane domain-containing protein [Bacteroidales bacterium]|nr:lysylphosphatidylglycerol synthase transmembrane domain-containing protein [Bacteroidales bacterium]